MAAIAERLSGEAEHLRSALEAGEIGTWDWDLGTGRMKWSAQMFRNLGLSTEAGDDLYRTLIGAVHPADRQSAESAFAGFRSRDGPLRLEVQILWPGDKPHWVVFLGNTIADAVGRPVRMLGITIDSTRRRKNEEAAAAALTDSEQRLRELNEQLEQRAEERARQLAASRAQMQAIFDNSPDWLTLFRAAADGSFRYEDLNRATERAYGLAYEQVIGRPLEEILGPEQAELPLRLMRACVLTGQNQRYTARRTLAGARHVIDVMFVRVPEKREGDYLIMATARDITEREAMEERLRQSQKMEAVGQLTGGLAHDFNNLLTAVIGNLELLGTRLAADPPVAAYARAAQRAAEHGAKLTKQLLAFARQQHLQPRAVDLNGVVDTMRDLLTRTIGATIRVRTALAPELWPALVDPTQIEVAILNLAINARDAMPLGGTLTIETGNSGSATGAVPIEIGDQDAVRISVRDTGIGMTDEVLRSAVEPFFTTKEFGKGSGLGLSQVYGMVQQSRGALRIESRLGEGSVVHLYLPRAAAAAGSPGEGREGLDRPQLNGRILVADDDPAVRDVTVQMLREAGYSVAEAGSGRDLLDALARDDAYDLLVVDVAMPGLNGIETVRLARERWPQLRVLYVTGYADLPIVGSGIGEDPLIRKPFLSAELANEVARAIRRGRPVDSDNVLAMRTPGSQA